MLALQIAIPSALRASAFEIAPCRKVPMLSGPRMYVEVWTPHGNDGVLAIIVRVTDPDDTWHFEADIIAERIEVETVSAKTLEALKALLISEHSGRRAGAALYERQAPNASAREVSK
jgi:hypothetical protein